MAYTKSNELMTRIALKYDSYENWVANNPVLLAGELAIAHIPTEHATDPTHFQNIPNVVMKVGDGTSHYNDLKFVSALAADVYDWAKAAQKPTYNAGEIVDLQKFVEDHSDFDTNTQYTIVPVAGAEYKYELKYKDLTDADFKSFTTPVYMDMSGADTRLKKVEKDLADLIGGDGVEGGIQDKINAAIKNLDATVEQAAGADGLSLKVVQTDGVLTHVEGAIAPNTYDAHGSAAAAEAAAKAHSDANLATAKKYTDDEVAKEASARKAAIEALTTEGVEGAQEGNVVKFVDKISQANGAIVAELGELHFQSAYNAETNKAATMADVTTAVADLNGAMHFEGVSTTDPAKDGVTIAEKPDYVAAAGDVVIYVNENKTPVEYVFDGAVWHQLGNESIAMKAIEALDVADIAVGADSTLSVIGEADGLIHATPVKIQIAQSQVTDLEDRLKNIEAEFGTGEGSMAQQVAANKDAIDTINGDDAGKSMRAVAIEEARNAVGALDKENAAQAGKYISALSQVDGVVTATYADLPVIPDLELAEGTATTPADNEVAVIADIDVAGHKITDVRVNVATMAGVDSRIAAGNGTRDVTGDDADGNFYVVNGLVQNNGAVTLKEKKLAKIAATGNIADLKQTANSYVVFNCGSSSVNI